MLLFGFVSSGTFRLISDQISSAVLAAVEGLYAEFRSQYLGSYSIDPSVDANGDPVQDSEFYWNSSSNVFRYYDGMAWNDFPMPSTPATGSVMLLSLATTLLAT